MWENNFFFLSYVNIKLKLKIYSEFPQRKYVDKVVQEQVIQQYFPDQWNSEKFSHKRDIRNFLTTSIKLKDVDIIEQKKYLVVWMVALIDLSVHSSAKAALKIRLTDVPYYLPESYPLECDSTHSELVFSCNLISLNYIFFQAYFAVHRETVRATCAFPWELSSYLEAKKCIQELGLTKYWAKVHSQYPSAD